MAIYASLQTTFNQFLLPRIEAFLLRFSAFQMVKITMIPFLFRKPLQSKIQTKLRLMSLSLLLPLKKQSLDLQNMKLCEPILSQKESCYSNQIGKVISYTKQTMVAYMSEEDLNRLCTYVAEYSSGDTLQKITPVKVDSQLKSIDIMHFGWNIGKAFGIKRIHTATFIKNVLPIPSVTWRSQRLNVKCHIRNLNVTLNYNN